VSIQSEWLSGTAGLPFYFGTGKLKITAKDLRDSDKASKIIADRAKQWVDMRRPAQPPKPRYTSGDFDVVIAALDNPMDANPDMTQIPSELQVDFLAKYLDIRAWLYEHQPTIKFTSGLIAQEIPPADTDKMKYMWSVNVLDDVTRVFDLLDAGCLAPSEALALRDVYPEFIMALMVSYLRATVDYLYKNQFSSLSGWQMAGLSSLAGVPMVNFNDVMAWQTGYAPSGPGRPQGSKAPQIAENEASDMQALGASV
jgi:hypothetical protein